MSLSTSLSTVEKHYDNAHKLVLSERRFFIPCAYMVIAFEQNSSPLMDDASIVWSIHWGIYVYECESI